MVRRADDIPDGWIGMDIGPRTAASTARRSSTRGTVFWNGPMGKFEIQPFADGTQRGRRGDGRRAPGVTVVGGGDSAAALAAVRPGRPATHVSTGGGAALEMLEGRTLPGVAALPTA